MIEFAFYPRMVLHCTPSIALQLPDLMATSTRPPLPGRRDGRGTASSAVIPVAPGVATSPALPISRPAGPDQAHIHAALSRISAAITGQPSPAVILAEAAAAANVALGGTCTMIWVRSFAGTPELAAITGELPDELREAMLGAAEHSPELRAAVRAKQPFRLDRDALAQTPLGQLLLESLGLYSLMALPLIRGDEALGVLAVGFAAKSGPPSAETESLALTIAGYVTAAVAAARSMSEAEVQLRAQRALHQISESMVSGNSGEAVLQQIAESSLTALWADRFTVWRFDPVDQSFVLGAEAGMSLPPGLNAAQLPAPGSGALAALLERRPRVFRNGPHAPEPMGPSGDRFLALGFDTIAIWPVLHDDQPLGVLCGCFLAEHRLHDRDVGLGETIANHAAAALHAADVYRQTERRAGELQALSDIGRMIADGGAATGLQELAAVARRAVAAATLTVWLHDDGADAFRVGAWAGEAGMSPNAPDDAFRAPGANRPQERSLREQHMVYAPARPIEPPAAGDGTAAGNAWSITAPMTHNGVALGVVTAEYRAGTPDSVPAEATLQSVANHFAYALVGSRLKQQVESHEREVTALRAISAAAVSSGGAREILDNVSGAVQAAVEALYGRLWLYDTTTDGLYRTGGQSEGPMAMPEPPAWLPITSPLGRALRTGQIAITTLDTPQLPPHVVQLFRDGQVQSALLLPIGGISEPLGVLVLGFSRVVTPGDPEVVVASALAGHAAIALGRASALEDYRVTEERLRMVSATSTDVMYSLRVTGANETVLEWLSEGLLDLCGYSAATLKSAGGWATLVHPEDRSLFEERRQQLLAGHVHVCDYRIVTRTGELRIVRDRARPVWSDELQRAVQVFGAARNVTEEVRTQQSLQALERVAAATLDALSAQIAILDAEGTVLAVNRAWRTASVAGATGGLTPALDLGTNYLALCDTFRGVLSVAASRIARGIRAVIARDRDEFKFEYSVPGGAGAESRWLVATVTLLGGDSRSVVVAHEDITDRKLAEEALVRQAHYDALTGLPNRTMLLEGLQTSLANASAWGRNPALLIMDLDRFKEVNDSFGHETGDVLLGLVADRLTNALQEQYLVARLGGDEFAVLVPGDERSAAPEVVADTVVMALRPPFLVDGLVFDIQASVGVAKYPEHGLDVQTLLRRADIAMYVAKHSSTGMAVYTQEQDRNQPRRLSLLAELRRAIDEDELHLVYHPQVELNTGEVLWVEALVRWSHPTLGPLPPDEFVPIAEQSGLIYQLTRWILRRSLRQAAAWHRQGINVGVAVNFSARDLQLPSLPDFVAASLTRYRVPASRLKIEITESSLIDEPDQVLRGVSQLRARGVKVVLDDFGMGYASLTHLKRLPIDELKIDKSFVRDLRVSELDAAIVRMTIELGHKMGATVVAEGVEDAETNQLLRELGCDAAQGFYLAEPSPPDRFRAWMLQRQEQSDESATSG